MGGRRFRNSHRDKVPIVDLPQDDVVISKDCATALFRVFQETLTNIARHANATEANVRLAENDGNLTLEVHDNGGGITSKNNSPQAARLGSLGCGASWAARGRGHHCRHRGAGHNRESPDS